MKKAIVTGGAGFIGSHIVEKLLEKNTKVICIDNFVAGKKENVDAFTNNANFQLVDADVSDLKSIISYFEDVDVVYHQAASKCTVCTIDPHLDLRVNGQGTFNVLEASRLNNVRKVVHASTGSVNGEAQYLPQDEKHPLNPVSFYGVSKLAGEKYCNAFLNYYNMDVTVLRYYHVYGPRQDHSDLGGVIPIFIRKILNGESPTIFGDGSQLRSFTYVNDLVDANFLVASNNSSKGKVYNCASGIKVTIKELAEKLLKIMNREDLEILYEDWRPGDIKVFDINNSRIKNLGLQFRTTFDDGLEETIQWLASELNK